MPQATTHTRGKILAAGLEMFSSKGFLGTTTREIAKEAGVAEVTLFRYFPSKEKLLEEVIDQFSLVPILNELLIEVAEMPYEEGLEVIANRLLDALSALKEWVIILQAEVRRSPDKLLTIYHSLLDQIFDGLASYFRTIQDAGILRQFDPHISARAFYGILFCYFNIDEVLHRKEYKPTDRAVAVRGFVDLFVNGTIASVGG